MFDIYTTPLDSPLTKTTTGKIHDEPCGHALRSRPLKETIGMTYVEAINKYGDQLCNKCFGKAKKKMEKDNK